MWNSNVDSKLHKKHFFLFCLFVVYKKHFFVLFVFVFRILKNKINKKKSNPIIAFTPLTRNLGPIRLDFIIDHIELFFLGHSVAELFDSPDVDELAFFLCVNFEIWIILSTFYGTTLFKVYNVNFNTHTHTHFKYNFNTHISGQLYTLNKNCTPYFKHWKSQI